MGLLPSANFFQKSSVERAHTQRASLQKSAKSISTIGSSTDKKNDEDFVLNTREIFEICRNKGVILSAKKLVIGMSKVPFVGHEVDSLGLNMSQARIDSTIASRNRRH